MLTRHKLRRQEAFLHYLFSLSTARLVRNALKRASPSQLRTLLLVVASVTLKKLPANEDVGARFFGSNKKKLLRQHLGSWARCKKFLATKDAEQWRKFLGQISSLIKPSLSVIFER